MMTIFSTFFLSVFGIFSLFGVRQEYAFRQLIYILISLLAFFLIKKIGRKFFKVNSRLFYWLIVVVLITTFLIGLEVKGSKRWLTLYFFNLQPSELIKIFFILYLSEYLVDIRHRVHDFGYFLKTLIYMFIPVFIILQQPDLGNASVLLFVFFVMLLFSNFPKKYILYTILGLTLLFPLSWFFLKGYQRERILTFFNPHIDTQGTAYNMIQAIITIGSGKFFGRGLGLGTQSRLYFLPENHTDFAFATLVEQFGFFGGVAVLIFYGIIIYAIARRCIKFYFQHDEESSRNFLFSIGILSYLIFQVFVNIGMNLGLLPVAGVALPFISFGGSSILAFFFGLALLP